MTDEDITKLASRLTKTLATKEDLNGVEKRLNSKLDALNDKANTILEYADNIEEIVQDHEKRLKRVEAVPVVAHNLNK